VLPLCGLSLCIRGLVAHLLVILWIMRMCASVFVYQNARVLGYILFHQSYLSL
jgi:hypothetical protein